MLVFNQKTGKKNQWTWPAPFAKSDNVGRHIHFIHFWAPVQTGTPLKMIDMIV